MSTRWSSRTGSIAGFRAAAGRARRGKAVIVGSVCAIALAGGCGYNGGQLLYGLGFGRMKKVEAQFTLTPNPVMILVDDDGGQVKYPLAKRYIAEAVAQELLRNKAAQRIIPPETVDALRQVHPNFDKRGCREVGEMAGAEQVLWLQVQEMLVDENIGGATDAAYVSVTAKVINVLEKEDRSRVRLWPESAGGAPASASISGAKAVELKTTDAMAQYLAGELATKVAKFFYAYRPGDFEQPAGAEGS